MAVVSMRVPTAVQKLFGEPPLFRGEDVSVYYSLMDEFAQIITPTTMIDWLRVKDATDHSWEVIRQRRFKILIIESLRDEVRESRQLWADEAAIFAARNDPNEKYCDTISKGEEVPLPDSEQDSAGLFETKMQAYVRIDKLIASAEQRRDRALREIARHRKDIAQRLRQACEDSDAGNEPGFARAAA